jgi:hypothetical protein
MLHDPEIQGSGLSAIGIRRSTLERCHKGYHITRSARNSTWVLPRRCNRAERVIAENLLPFVLGIYDALITVKLVLSRAV